MTDGRIFEQNRKLQLFVDKVLFHIVNIWIDLLISFSILNLFCSLLRNNNFLWQAYHQAKQNKN